jgi:hypothetical protein
MDGQLTYQQWELSDKPDFLIYWATEKWGKRLVGRVKQTPAPHGVITWSFSINPPMPIPAFGHGRADTKDQALLLFKEAFARFVDEHTDADFEAAWKTLDKVR